MKLKSCPFCGEYPSVSVIGSCIDIECCVSMSIQKCDELTKEERNTWSNSTAMHSKEAEAKVLGIISTIWNKRVNK